MHANLAHHRSPGHALPIETPVAALAAFEAVLHRPLRSETIVLLLDDQRRGRAVLAVNGTINPDAVIEIVELVSHPAVHREQAAAIVVASVRPNPLERDTPDLERDDLDRWLELSQIADDAGVELLEWFVIDPRSVRCPRDEAGAAPRW